MIIGTLRRDEGYRRQTALHQDGENGANYMRMAHGATTRQPASRSPIQCKYAWARSGMMLRSSIETGRWSLEAARHAHDYARVGSRKKEDTKVAKLIYDIIFRNCNKRHHSRENF